MTVRLDLNELKLCMYQAISQGLDNYHLVPPPEKISAALASAIYAHLDADAARVERFIEELLRCMEQHTGHKRRQYDDEDRARCQRRKSFLDER